MFNILPNKKQTYTIKEWFITEPVKYTRSIRNNRKSSPLQDMKLFVQRKIFGLS